MAVKSSEIRKETKGTKKIAFRDTLFRFSKTILINIHLVILRFCYAQLKYNLGIKGLRNKNNLGIQGLRN